MPGAWTQPEGRTQAIFTASYYQAGHRFDGRGKRIKQPAYTQYQLNPYIEHGLSERWTVGGSTFLQRADDGVANGFGLGDTELFARAQLYRDGRFAIALQPAIKLPSPFGNDRPAIGSRTPDAGASVIGGMRSTLFGLPNFSEMEVGFRYRFGDPLNQIVASSADGIWVRDDVLLLAQGFATLRIGAPGTASYTQSARDDYSLLRLQWSGIYYFAEDQAVQLGAFYHFFGLDTGAGGGVLLAYWRNF